MPRWIGNYGIYDVLLALCAIVGVVAYRLWFWTLCRRIRRQSQRQRS